MIFNKQIEWCDTLVEQLEMPVFVLNDSGEFEYVSETLLEHFPDANNATDPPSLEQCNVTQFISDKDFDKLEAIFDTKSAPKRDSVTVQFERWKGQDPAFEVIECDGVAVGCQPPEITREPTDDTDQFLKALEQLHEVTNRLYASDSVATGLEITTEAAVETLGFDWCLLAEATDGVFKIREVTEGSPVTVDDILLSTTQGVAGAVYQSGESCLVGNIDNSDIAAPTHPFICSTVTVPVGDWGIFQALSKTENAFDEHEKQLAETLIAPLATKIEQIQRKDALRTSNEVKQRQRTQIEALHSVATEMKTATTRAEVYDMTIEAVEDILEFNFCVIDEVVGDFLVPQTVGSNMSDKDYYERIAINSSGNLGCLTYREEEPFVVDSLQDAGFEPANSNYASAISLPLADWGVFQVVSTEEAAFDEVDCRVIELLTEYAVAAIDRIERETELKRRAKEFEAQISRLDEFASIVSHDLRNPLNVASLRTQQAMRTGNTDELETVLDSIERMDSIIENVLTLARQGNAAEEHDPVALSDAIYQCWELVPSEQASLTVTGDRIIKANENQLCHLFENLFRNAVEHGSTAPEDGTTSGETETVTIETGVLSDSRGFYVEDDGPGIDDENREKVFDRGYSQSRQGTGLGLAIVAEVVDSHGWDIRVGEGSAGGARFEITGVAIPDRL